MPAEPIEYRILTNLQDALQAITVAGGYHYDVAAVDVKLDPNQGVESLIAPDGLRPFVLIEVMPDRREYFPAFGTRIVRPMMVHWANNSDPSVDEDFARLYFRGCADIEQAITGDISRGGLAIDTRIVNCQYGPDRGSRVWAMVSIEIALRRTYGQPNG